MILHNYRYNSVRTNLSENVYTYQSFSVLRLDIVLLILHRRLTRLFIAPDVFTNLPLYYHTGYLKNYTN